MNRVELSVLLALVVLWCLVSVSLAETPPLVSVESESEIRLEFDPGQLGRAFAFSGSTAVIGRGSDDQVAENAGAAFVVSRNSLGRWNLVQELRPSELEKDDRFGLFVAMDGDYIAVATNGDDDAAIGAGAVYLYQRDLGGEGKWGLLKKLTTSDAAPGDGLDRLSLQGSTLAVGATGANKNGVFDAGAGWVFERDAGGPNNWGEVARLTPVDPPGKEFDQFGYVGLDGDVIAVGAPTDGGGEPGLLYFFERNAGGENNWGQVGTFSDPTLNRLGLNVAVSGDLVAAGVASRGFVFVLERLPGTLDWEVVKRIDGTLDFGSEIDLEGSTLIVGESSFSNGDGAAFVFHRDAGGRDEWGEVLRFEGAEGESNDLGEWVVVTPELLAAGAPFDSIPDTGFNGAIHVFDYSIADDRERDGVPDVGDNCSLRQNPDQRDTNADGFGNICDADLNNDLIVTYADIEILLSVFGTDDADADLNGDGTVNNTDRVIARRSLGKRPGPSGVNPVRP